MTMAERAAKYVIDEMEYIKSHEPFLFSEYLVDVDPDYIRLVDADYIKGDHTASDQYLEDFADAVKVQVDQALEVLRVSGES